MKRKFILTGLLLFLFLNRINSQDFSQLIVGKWLVVDSKATYTENFVNDLTFYRLEFENASNANLFLKVVANGLEYFKCTYKINNDSLSIKSGVYNYKFNIESINNDTLVLSNHLKYYYLVKYERYESNYNSRFVVTRNDTINVNRIEPIRFNGDFYKSYLKNIIRSPNDSCSTLLKVKLRISNSGELDTIIVNEKSNYREELISWILKTQKKWKPINKSEKNIYQTYEFFVLIASNEIEYKLAKNPQELCQVLFNKGYNHYLNGSLEDAKFYFSECITFFKFFDSIKPLYFQRYNVQPFWINSVINKAAILDAQGKINEACKLLESVIAYDKEAYNYYQNKCFNR